MDIAFIGTTRLYGPSVSVRDRAFLLGDGCFETLRVTELGVEGAGEHISLLRRSADRLSISGFPSRTQLDRALAELASQARSEASMRITLSRGAGGRGADSAKSEPLTVISLSPLTQARPYPPLTAMTSSVLRNDTSPLSTIKSTSYADNLAARREANSSGADEALMLNTKGRPACFAMGNLFVEAPDGTWATPPESEGVRPGYMRQMILEHLRARSCPVEIRPLEADELTAPQTRIHATNSLWGLRAVARLDSRTYETDLSPFGG